MKCRLRHSKAERLLKEYVAPERLVGLELVRATVRGGSHVITFCLKPKGVRNMTWELDSPYLIHIDPKTRNEQSGPYR